MASWAEFKQYLEDATIEDSITHMYLDTKGAVTVGVGNKFESVEGAKKLGFVNRKTQKAATKEEIEADYNSVSKQPKGLKASAYEKYTKLDLPDSIIDSLLDSRIAGFKKDLKRHFTKFDSYPTTVQFALLDMAFNLGITGLLTKFPSFDKAVKKEDWTKAGKESHRYDVGTLRNDAVKKWFDDAAKLEAKKSAAR